MSQTKVLAFDIGIKNLAFCLIEGSRVMRLENVNILQSVEKTKCIICSLCASFTAGSQHYCKRHIPKSYVVISKSPTAIELKSIAKTQGIDIKIHKTKAAILNALSITHAFPYTQPKQPKASTQSLEQLHDALRTFITLYWTDFSQATHVLLENQPAFKNPHMKSVQVLLFTALRERFIQQTLDQIPITAPPKFHLVHAKKKVKDAESGDAGYAERKSKSEQRAQTLFDELTLTTTDPTILTSWNNAKKKSDMADAVCMSYDFLVNLPK